MCTYIYIYIHTYVYVYVYMNQTHAMCVHTWSPCPRRGWLFGRLLQEGWFSRGAVSEFAK